MKKTLNLGVIGIDHGHIFDMLDEMIKEGCSCNYFWTDGDPLTLQEFNKKYLASNHFLFFEVKYFLYS